MKIKMIHTVVHELEVELPDELDSIVGVITAADEAHKRGESKPLAEPRSLGHQVISVSMQQDGKEVLLLAHRLGQIVVTEEGGMHFNETRDLTIARKAQLEEEAKQQKEADAERPAEERTN